MRQSTVRTLAMMSLTILAVLTPSVGAAQRVADAESAMDVVSLGSDLAVGFEGQWDAEDLNLVLEALGTVSRAVGSERFADLVWEALPARSGRPEALLTIVKDASGGHPPATWYPARGIIVLRASFFDLAYMEAHHRWTVLTVWGATAPEEITTQRAVLAHELGHVLFDGLEAERSVDQRGAPSLATQYVDAIDLRNWPHQQSSPKENIVTEMALWALGTARPANIEQFRVTALIPTLVAKGVHGH